MRFISLDEQSGEYFGYRDAHDFLGIIAGATGQVGGSVRIPRACLVESDAAKIARLTAEAEQTYPKLKGGPLHNHHIDPKYLGGDPKGAKVPLNRAYHRLISNEFRRLYAYGQSKLDATERAIIAKKVYGKYPLP